MPPPGHSGSLATPRDCTGPGKGWRTGGGRFYNLMVREQMGGRGTSRIRDGFSYGRSSMRSIKWVAIVASILVLFAVGCAVTKPVMNVTDAPVNASKPNPSLDEVSKAILRGGRGAGWQMSEIKPGHMVGTLIIRTHTAVVDIRYSAKSYSIIYKDSTNVNYDGQNIHNRYNDWIMTLDKNIRAQLSTL